MANLASQISPFEPVKIHSAKKFQLQLPEQHDLTQFLEPVALRSEEEFHLRLPNQQDFPQLLKFPITESKIPVCSDLPIMSSVNTYPLLSPEETELPATLPLDYPGDELFTSNGWGQFTPIDIIAQEIKDLFPDIELFSANTTEVPLEVYRISVVVQVSDNLLRRLVPPQSVSGMLYADRYWKTEKVPEYISNTTKAPKGNQRNPVRPKELHEVEGVKVLRPRFKPSFWDLIFVLLQPPLEFGKTENLLLPHDLYPYQIEGVKFLVSNEHALLADDMGTGKTVMTIVALKLLMQSNKIKKVLILCPPSVLYEWKRHIADWFPESVACFVRGTQEIRSIEWKTPAHIYVTSYDTLRSDVENGLLPPEKWNSFDVVVVDEAHHIKNPNTDRSRAIKKLKPIIRWALTGTPIQNKIEDMAALFDFLYPGYIRTPFDLYEERIKEKVAPYFLRRRKQDVLKDLPSKIKQDIWLEMSEEQRAEYNRAELEIVLEIEGMGESITKQHIFAKMQQLRQICNFPSQKNTSPKLDALKEQIEDISESGYKVIVFTQYINQGVTKLEAALNSYGTATIKGGQSDSARMVEIEKFKHLEKITVLIASLKSGGEGLNLTEASYVIHFDHWWNPAVMWQAEDRVHRRGQKQTVNVYSYWMYGTIDERIYEILRKKGLLIQNIVDGLSEDTIEASITMDELFSIVGARKPAKEKPTFDPHKWQNLNLDQIHQQLFQISSQEFEELVERLMHYLGYPNVKVTKKSHDGGIDVISTRMIENGVERIAAQCKRYKQPVSVQIAREFLGAIQDDKSIVKGYLVTTSEFTSECITYCIRHHIEMIPGIKIAEYVKRFGLEM